MHISLCQRTHPFLLLLSVFARTTYAGLQEYPVVYQKARYLSFQYQITVGRIIQTVPEFLRILTFSSNQPGALPEQ